MSEGKYFIKKEFLKTGPMPFLSYGKAILEVGQPIDFEIVNGMRSGPIHFLAQNNVLIHYTPSEVEPSYITSIPFDFTCQDCIENQKKQPQLVCDHIVIYKPTINKKHTEDD